MGKLNEIAQKAYECAVRRGKIDPDNDSNNNLHRDLLEEVAEVFECTGEKSPHIKEYLDVEEETGRCNHCCPKYTTSFQM